MGAAVALGCTVGVGGTAESSARTLAVTFGVGASVGTGAALPCGDDALLVAARPPKKNAPPDTNNSSSTTTAAANTITTLLLFSTGASLTNDDSLMIAEREIDRLTEAEVGLGLEKIGGRRSTVVASDCGVISRA